MVEGLTWSQLLDQAGAEAVTSAGFDALPEGVYDLEVVEATHKLTKTTPAKDMWNVQYKVNGGQYNNRRIFNNIVLTLDNDKALGFFFRNMAAHGLPKEYFSTNPTNEQISSALKGRQVRAKLGVRTYNGEEQNEVKGYSAPSKAVAAPPAGSTPVAPAGVPAPPMPAAAAPAPPAPVAPAAPADPWAAAPAPAPAAPAVPPPPPLEGLPF